MRSGLGYHSTWLPQKEILRHEVSHQHVQMSPFLIHYQSCGWIVTHCGHNSMMEALSEGVPLYVAQYDSGLHSYICNL